WRGTGRRSWAARRSSSPWCDGSSRRVDRPAQVADLVHTHVVRLDPGKEPVHLGKDGVLGLLQNPAFARDAIERRYVDRRGRRIDYQSRWIALQRRPQLVHLRRALVVAHVQGVLVCVTRWRTPSGREVQPALAAPEEHVVAAGRVRDCSFGPRPRRKSARAGIALAERTVTTRKVPMTTVRAGVLRRADARSKAGRTALAAIAARTPRVGRQPRKYSRYGRPVALASA